MDSSVKDKHIILGFIGFTICLISFFITLIVAESFNQDNFVRLIVFLCSNLLGWLFYLSFQTIIFDTYQLYKIKFGKKEMKEITTETVALQEEEPQNTIEPVAQIAEEASPDAHPHRAEYRPEASRRNPFKL